MAKHNDIDLVYLWVDGNDPVWQAKRAAFCDIALPTSQINCKGRAANNDELKFSLRTVEKYAPWVRKIFIVTDNQTPDWIDTANPKITIVNHSDILPEHAMPCFNSVIIEHFLYKIPDLSEHFLYANDDMLLNKPVSPDTFFAEDGFPIVRLKKYPFARLRYFFMNFKRINVYRKSILNSHNLIKSRFEVDMWDLPHHNIDAYCKSDYKAVAEDVFAKEIAATVKNHMRNKDDVQRIIYSYFNLAVQHGHLRYVNKSESCTVRMQRKDYKEYLDKHSPKFFCINDSERVSDSDRERAKEFLNEILPEKSKFEKNT